MSRACGGRCLWCSGNRHPNGSVQQEQKLGWGSYSYVMEREPGLGAGMLAPTTETVLNLPGLNVLAAK